MLFLIFFLNFAFYPTYILVGPRYSVVQFTFFLLLELCKRLCLSIILIGSLNIAESGEAARGCVQLMCLV